MVNLFKPYTIGELEIRNRFIRSATTSAWSDEYGIIRDEMIQYYERLAAGGVGLIVKGHLYIDSRGKAHNGMAGIHDDSVIPKLRELTESVHRNGGAILAQINFGGYQASEGERMGPSDYKNKKWSARAMTTTEIWDVVDKFGAAAERAIKAGFDGVQLHAAHGYLISEFLSKHANTRTDEWGGDLKNRMRLLKEVYLDVRGRLGPDAVISMKINSDDFSVDGFTVDDSALVSQALASLGIDMIEVSGGGIGSEDVYRSRARHTDPTLSEPSFAGHCEKIRATTKPKTLALVNGFRTKEAMQTIVDRGVADLISMSRPFIREPDLVKRLQAGKEEASCIRCDTCESDAVFSKAMLRCRIDNP
jgi:2,4-dienoyl-CoA reductase-like NADH-dependent reductase (Old Yellow Enzyme family)